MHGLLTASGRMVHPMMVAPALAASTAPVLANHAAAGAAFFNNMRTPAALLAAGALKDAFVLQGRDQGKYDKRGWKMLIRAYAILMVFSFGLELSCVFKCTGSGTRLLGGGFDPMGESVIAMLVREFEWEYVSVRAQFVTGMLCFIMAQALRVFKELAEHVYLARATMAFLLFATAEMLSFFNSHLVFYGGYTQLIKRYFHLAFHTAFPWVATKGAPIRIGPILAVLALATSMFYCACAVIDVDGDNSITRADFEEIARRFRGNKK